MPGRSTKPVGWNDMSPSPTDISDAASLQNAVAHAHAGQTIHLRPGTYQIGATLAVPDGVTLIGSGVMQGGTPPTGFKQHTETKIVVLASLKGDVVTLGDNASLEKLTVEDVAGRSGNAVSVRSRDPIDSVMATIIECQIVNPNKPAGDESGPTGGGIVVMTRNLGGPAAPKPDTGARVKLSMSRSIVRSAKGAPALFAINSASAGRLDIYLTENRFEGRLDVVGGIPRGDEVTGAEIAIHSADNLYQPLVPFPNAWSIVGGSSPPPFFPSGPGASSNHVRVDSSGDQIKNTVLGILAFGSRRFGTQFGPNFDNRVLLNVQALALSTITADGSADFLLAGAASVAMGPDFPPEFPPGDRNVVSLLLQHSSGSGPRENGYADVSGPRLPWNLSIGNRLELLGTAMEFANSNSQIDPAPPVEFFTDPA
jgi:hypothetical protein